MHTSADKIEQTISIQHGPPYGSPMAVVGGVPTLRTDIPIAAVLLALFVTSAAAHMTVLQLNKRAGLKFLFSGMLFVMSVLRTVALSMRIVWATHPHTANIAVASGILTQTGSVLIFIINLILSQRIVRAYHPKFGWHPITSIAFYFLIGCVVGSLVMVIVVTVQSVLTLDSGLRQSDRIVQLFAGTYMAVLAFLPLPIVVIAVLYPHKSHVEKFGAGRWRTKVCLLLFAAAVATLGASFRIATAYAARPVNHPAWYHSRVCYYCFNFVTDLIVSVVYLFSRFDRRFIVPNGAKGPGDYSKGLRDRPRSAHSNADEEGNVTDPEKLSSARDSSNETGSEKTHLPIGDGDDEKRVDKGKGKEVNVEGDEKHRVSESSGSTPEEVTPKFTDSQTQTYSPHRPWNAVSWPFRASWTTPRLFGPVPTPAPAPVSEPEPEASSAKRSNAGGSIKTDLSTTETAKGLSHTGSSRSIGAETSSTYIQEPELEPEPEPIRFRTFVQRHHHHHPQHRQNQIHHHHQQQQHQHYNERPPHHSNNNPYLQNNQSYVFGQALTSDAEIHRSPDADVWPSMSETHYLYPLHTVTYTTTPGGPGPHRSNSAAASISYAGSSRTPDHASHPIGRSRSCYVDRERRMEGEEDGGWI
ncbi:hypothetical protein F5B22DRAFT_641931 [Xylaria bambusicola]|uniref:uncharacterized protein n=1 Tax=Xylaria bambusicola TaxID=326684 RepID=UPI0020086C4B|nr:uncharacterized protein F5B22DRAFT_641931 [Xylaria bambusicola]KAI0525774.1 hypothetical protein F5B22DRAFT_641931 [Xylaria bambusicola]